MHVKPTNQPIEHIKQVKLQWDIKMCNKKSYNKLLDWYFYIGFISA